SSVTTCPLCVLPRSAYEGRCGESEREDGGAAGLVRGGGAADSCGMVDRIDPAWPGDQCGGLVRRAGLGRGGAVLRTGGCSTCGATVPGARGAPAGARGPEDGGHERCGPRA